MKRGRRTRIIDEKYNTWRSAVYRRDNNECVACGAIALDKRGIHAHHILSWSQHKEARYEIDNGRTLCGVCHSMLHAWWSITTEKISRGKAFGARNGMNTCPDRRPTGNRNGMRKHPERSSFSPIYQAQTGKPPIKHASGDRNRFSRAYCERTGTPPIEYVRGENHGSRTKPERVARGDRHISKTHPEKVVRGDAHWSRQHPEKLARGERHGTKTHPGCLPLGENRPDAVLTADLVRSLRYRHDILGESYAALARELGVARNTVARAVKGITYRNVHRLPDASSSVSFEILPGEQESAK